MKNSSFEVPLSETEIIKSLLERPESHFLNEYFAYIPMRLTGLGLAERIIDNKAKIFNRARENFVTDELMKVYASVPICVGHPVNENGDFEPLGFRHSGEIIGNAIHSFLRDNEIWIIARIHNIEVVDLILSRDISTSPYFISKEVEHEVENDVIYDEIPLVCNHLAIVDKGFWDKKITDKCPISKELNMDTEKIDVRDKVEIENEKKVDNVETEASVDSEVERVDMEIESDEMKVDSELSQDIKADSVDVSSLVDEINALREQVDSLLRERDSAKSDEELKEKDEVIEAINEIADSSDIVERVRVRVGDSARDVLEKFLKVNRKHVSEKYHALVDSIPSNAYLLVKNDVLADVKNNLVIKGRALDTGRASGWRLNNGEILGYKF